MHFSRLLRTITLGLTGLGGGLIVIGLVAWIHYWLYGSFNPGKVLPLENWSLTLSIGSFLIQLAASIEAVLIGISTRLRWIKLKRGRFAIALLSLISLSFTIGGVRQALSSQYINLFGVLLYQLIITLPLWFAWFFLRSHRTEQSTHQHS
ncbi:hypothetical protein N836_22850 [Leptolyngbya sp. Heron Island J]|uniref:hypothetical protein n=1 Tax=Leptolyngbya sp. Heron Island J TaxID=1385935 RepID=UPI0003B9A107|nr:hypothetical protein [Leptolyngbya sp. Heron Island J]ESA33234.1 hypothetical protein N836_22850 [Leptolyngbya sp. Heron Island J]